MPDFHHKYNLNSVYICLLLLVYNICKSNYEYLHVLLNKICLLDYNSFIIITIILGLYLFLRNICFEVNITFSIKYK